MNLKKAFRYQNLINDMIKKVHVLVSNDQYQTCSITRIKSELNKLALVKNYEDETKEFSAKNISSIGFNSLLNRQIKVDNNKNYCAKNVVNLFRYLVIQRTMLAEAINKTKNKVAIKINDKTYSYDAALAYTTGYRMYISYISNFISGLSDQEQETKESERIITALDQPPVDVSYPVYTKITTDMDMVNVLKNDIEALKVKIDEISDQIEAASLSAEVKFNTELPITATIETLYDMEDIYMNTNG